MRQEARAAGRRMLYDGRWRDRDPAEAPAGIEPVVRFKAPRSGDTRIDDLVQGPVTVTNDQMDDMVLLRANGTPTYMLSVVVDEFAKLPSDVGEEELERARTQLKASVLMSRESSMSRCEQLAQQLLVYGRPLPLEEIVRRIEAVDCTGLGRVLGRMRGAQPSLAVIGPTAGVDSFDSLRDRLTDGSG